MYISINNISIHHFTIFHYISYIKINKLISILYRTVPINQAHLLFAVIN